MHQKVVIRTVVKRQNELIVETAERYIDRGPRIVRNPVTGRRIKQQTQKRTSTDIRPLEERLTDLLERCRL